jgi:hypothetical protein
MDDEEFEEHGVWIDSPIDGRANSPCYALGLRTDALSDVMPFMVVESRNVGLVLFDMQAGCAYLPDGRVLRLTHSSASAPSNESQADMAVPTIGSAIMAAARTALYKFLCVLKIVLGTSQGRTVTPRRMARTHNDRLQDRIKKALLQIAQRRAPDFEKAVWRFHSDDYRMGSKVLLIGPAGVQRISLHDDPEMAELNSVGRELWYVESERSKRFCVCLLWIDKERGSEFYFEHQEKEKWDIDKMAAMHQSANP